MTWWISLGNFVSRRLAAKQEPTRERRSTLWRRMALWSTNLPWMQPLFLLVQHFPPMVVQQFVFSFLLLISPCLGCIATVSREFHSQFLTGAGDCFFQQTMEEPLPPPLLLQFLRLLRQLSRRRQRLPVISALFPLSNEFKFLKKEKKILAACLAGWVFFPTTNFCYLLLDSMGRTPAASQSYCQSLTTGSNLVSMHSQAENDFVVSLTSPGLPAKRRVLFFLEKSETFRVLVGAERIAPVGNAFAYLDNSPVSLRPINTNVPFSVQL